MSSVTNRIKEINSTQPRGGFIPLSWFLLETYCDNNEITIISKYYLKPLSPIITGLAVDYLTRAHFTNDVTQAFQIPLKGATVAKTKGKRRKSEEIAARLLNGITGLDDVSIVNACKLATYDVWYRSPIIAPFATDQRSTSPYKAEIDNIRNMVHRTINFFESHGPIINCGFDFSPEKCDTQMYKNMVENQTGSYGGYTPTVSSGDADYLTDNTIWDLKVSKHKPDKSCTLQILMYWIMGKHSGRKEFNNITKIGIFNPFFNSSFILDVSNIPEEIIRNIENNIICYP